MHLKFFTRNDLLYQKLKITMNSKSNINSKGSLEKRNKEYTIFQELQPDNKENVPLRMNYSHLNRDRKYMYMGTQDIEQQNETAKSNCHQDHYNLPKMINNHYSNYSSFSVSPKNQANHKQISFEIKSPQISEIPNDAILLKRQLLAQRQKFKDLQQKTINDQMHVLQQLAVLDGKFNSMKRQKQKLQRELVQYKKSRSRQGFVHYTNQNQGTDWQDKYNQLYKQHKKVKGVQKALIDMMNKVQGTQTSDREQYDLHDAWKWVKGIVWEYEAIRKKALQWKKVYDQVRYQQQ